VFFTFFFPVLIVVIFGALVGTRPTGGGLFAEPPGYYVAGYLAVVVLFTPLSRVGSTIARHRDGNRFEKLATTPLRRWEWLLAHTLVNVAVIGLAGLLLFVLVIVVTGAEVVVGPTLLALVPLVVVGVALFLYTTTLGRPPAAEGGTYWSVREVAIVLAAGGVPLIFGGIAIRLPLRRAANRLSYLGIAVCLVSLGWFVTVYPDNGWPTDTGHTGVIGLYTVGIAVIGLASVVVPMLSRAETETASERAAREAAEAAEADEADEELARTQAELEEARAATETATAELEALRESKARFELYEDRGGGHRWRLRHDNGNIVADSGQGYASKQKAKQGLNSVKSNAPGASVEELDGDGESAAE
jgi:uncharacterized protein YegP (UPF0339 family)